MSSVRISGNTFAHKAALKAMGLSFRADAWHGTSDQIKGWAVPAGVIVMGDPRDSLTFQAIAKRAKSVWFDEAKVSSLFRINFDPSSNRIKIGTGDDRFVVTEGDDLEIAAKVEACEDWGHVCELFDL